MLKGIGRMSNENMFSVETTVEKYERIATSGMPPNITQTMEENQELFEKEPRHWANVRAFKAKLYDLFFSLRPLGPAHGYCFGI